MSNLSIQIVPTRKNTPEMFLLNMKTNRRFIINISLTTVHCQFLDYSWVNESEGREREVERRAKKGGGREVEKGEGGGV